MNSTGISGLLAAIVLLGGLTGGVAIAQDNGQGPGMMHGYGGSASGSCMMGRDGHGMGPRMMSSHGRFGPLAALNLSDAQRDRIFKILESDQRQRWAVMGKMMEDTHKMREQLALEQPDPGKVGAIYSQISALRQQIIVAHVRASNEIHNVNAA
ncbi:MAG: Spy/CpxP family protein refolding chaperone [Acidiferrobacterales bacterium]